MKTLVVGAGAAGLWCALHAADSGLVTVVGPDPTAGSATVLAQGGIAAAIAEGDRPESHAADTISAGAGLCDPAAVDVLTAEAPAAIDELLRVGMPFDAGGAPTLEGGHSARRVLHAGGDATGRTLLEALLRAAHRDPRIRWIDARAEALVVDGARVAGVRTAGSGIEEADRVVLATGGACGIYRRRTGPDRSTGQGLALAWDAGAALADLEFVQFHPTALDVPGHPARLLTEALRGEGAVLMDADGRRFMPAFHDRAELAPRDVVARAITAVRDRTGGPVFLDASGVEDVRRRFPTAAASCDEAGLDLAEDRIPVTPAAHYFTGGVLTDTWGRTTVPGLFASGEAASTGVHGANRLASNSLLEALVFGRRAARAEDGTGPAVAVAEPARGWPRRGGLVLEEIRSLADRYLGVARNGADLEAVEAKFQDAGEQVGGDRTATLMAWLVTAAALRREESRGGHHRTDHPETRTEWRVRQAVSRNGWARIPA